MPRYERRSFAVLERDFGKGVMCAPLLYVLNTCGGAP